MAVIFEQIEGWFRPRFICDGCQQPITDIRNAMVVYEEPTAGEVTSITPVLHCHKEDLCQMQTRRKGGHQGWSGMWDELANHLVMLAADTGLFPTEFRKQYKHLQSRGRVPPPRALS